MNNTKAMRDALELVQRNATCIVCPEITCPECGTDFQMRGNLPQHVIEAVNAALAAPERNCDLPYNDSVEMYGKFKDWCKAKGHTMEPMLAWDAFDWLLSPATEQKGETDEQK